MLRRLILLIALLGCGHAWALTPAQAGAIAAGDSDDRVKVLNAVVSAADVALAPFIQALLDDTVKAAGGKAYIVQGDKVVEAATGRSPWRIGDRVGVAWLHDTCGHCRWCAGGRENLCASARFTGWNVDGGYADYTAAPAEACVAIPPGYGDVEAAPLLCAGLIGYRAWRMAGDPAVVGLYGFGAAAHLIAQVALAEGRTVYAFTRAGDAAAQALAWSLGVHWAGDSGQTPPQPMDAAILFAPAGELVPQALGQLLPGGTVVCAGIHMSDIPSFPYRLLWMERSLRSVANLTRRDGHEFMAWAGRHRLRWLCGRSDRQAAQRAPPARGHRRGDF